MGFSFGGSANKSNINKIQTFQNVSLEKITDAAPFVSNHT